MSGVGRPMTDVGTAESKWPTWGIGQNPNNFPCFIHVKHPQHGPKYATILYETMVLEGGWYQDRINVVNLTQSTRTNAKCCKLRVASLLGALLYLENRKIMTVKRWQMNHPAKVHPVCSSRIAVMAGYREQTECFASSEYCVLPWSFLLHFTEQTYFGLTPNGWSI